VLTLAGILFIAVFSPLLALRTIRIDGTSRVGADEVHASLEDQLGTPLALVDYERITTELAAFPLIRSYVTETIPPDTLVIHIVERQPIGELLVNGTYRLVDPAGVVVQESATRAGGVPLIDLGGADATDPAFDAVVQVLLVMPASLVAQVDTITAKTRDDVSLVLSGVGQRVEWGSAENSAKKAVVLSRLIAITDPARAGTFDVSAPGNAIFSPS
jgi:cell division protein FtsQ